MILQIVLFLKDSLDDAQVARLRVQMLVLFFDCNVDGTIEVIRYLFSYGTARVGSFFRAFFFFLPVFFSIFSVFQKMVRLEFQVIRYRQLQHHQLRYNVAGEKFEITA